MAQGLFGTDTPEAQLQQTRLTPTGTPGSTFVRPPQVSSGGNLRALTEALGGLNSALNSYADTKDNITDDPNSRINKEEIAKLSQMSIEELNAEAQSGSRMGIRVQQDALETLMGERAHVDFRAVVAERYETEFDKSTGDFDEWFEGVREEYAGGLQSEVAKGNFYRLTDSTKSTLLDTTTKTRVDTAKKQINATIVDSWYVKIGDMVGQDGSADPVAIAEQVFSSSKTNKDFFGMSGEEQDATIWALAQRAAMDGEPDITKALLFTKRDGVALAEVPAYAAKSHNLVETGQGLRDKTDKEVSLGLLLDVTDKVTTGQFTEEDARALDGNPNYTPQQLASMVSGSKSNREQIARNGATAEQKRLLRLNSDNAKATVDAQSIAAMGQVGGVFKLRDVDLPTATGATAKYTRTEQIENARLHYENLWANQEQALIDNEGMDPKTAKSTMDAVRLAWYSGNGVTNQQWKNRLTSLPMMVNPETFAQNPAAAAKFSEYAEEWRTMNSQNPAYADALLDDKSREFLDLYDTARTAHDMTETDALAYTAGWLARPEMERSRYQIKPQDAGKIVSDVMSDLDVGGANTASFGILNQKVQTWASQGLNAEQIRANTEKWAVNSTVIVKDTLIVAERPLPGDFVVVADRYLDGVFKQVGEAYGIESADELFLQSNKGENRWQVWSKTTGTPIGNHYLDAAGISTAREAEDNKREELLRESYQSNTELNGVKQEAMSPMWEEFYKEETARIARLRVHQKSWLNGYNPPNNSAADAAQEELDRLMKKAGLSHLAGPDAPDLGAPKPKTTLGKIGKYLADGTFVPKQ